MSERVNFHTPVGRWVSGSLTEKRTHDMSNAPIDEDKQRYEFGLAIRKDDPGFPALQQTIVGAAMAGYQHRPDIQQRITNWCSTLQGFSMKIADGDKPSASTGQVSPNTAGCWVLYFGTKRDILAANAQDIQIDPAAIKRGWFVDVSGSTVANGRVDKNAGVHMNPICVRLIAEGDEIVSGVSVSKALENAPAAPTQLPPGARPVGSAPQAPASSGMPGTGMPGQQPASSVPGATGVPGAPADQATAPALMPGMAPTQPPAQAPTASSGDAQQHPPHQGYMQPPSAEQQTAHAAPGMPAMPGAGTPPEMPGQ